MLKFFQIRKGAIVKVKSGIDPKSIEVIQFESRDVSDCGSRDSKFGSLLHGKLPIP
jgi:hypothetical protein